MVGISREGGLPEGVILFRARRFNEDYCGVKAVYKAHHTGLLSMSRDDLLMDVGNTMCSGGRRQRSFCSGPDSAHHEALIVDYRPESCLFSCLLIGKGGWDWKVSAKPWGSICSANSISGLDRLGMGFISRARCTFIHVTHLRPLRVT